MPNLAEDLKQIRHQIRVVRNRFENTGTIEREDLDFLCESTVRHTIMSGIAESDWIALKTLQLTSHVEIENLKAQLAAK